MHDRLTNDALVKLTIPSSVGPLFAFASDRGIRAIVFSDADPARHGVNGKVIPAVAGGGAHATLLALADQMREYFAGLRSEFDLPLDPRGTDFQLLAWQALRQIPFGQTLSYAAQARAIGKPSAYRAIGAADGRNPLAIVVPCHRVVGAGGALTGFSGGLDRKRALLAHEGALRSSQQLPFAD